MRKRPRLRWLTFCGIQSLLCSTGCCIWNSSWKLATLPSGDTIHVNEFVRNFTFQEREVIYRYGGGGEHDRAVTVSKGKPPWAETSLKGYDVFQDRNRVTVWSIFGRGTKPLTVIDVAKARRGENPFLQPGRSSRPKGRRIACHIDRELIRVKVSDGGTVCLYMDSHRDAGSKESTANRDDLVLAYSRERRHWLTTQSEGVSTTVLAIEGDQCIDDPFISSPSVDVRWDGARRGVWVLDHGTRRVLGGFQVGSVFFERDGTPAWATATTGTLIGSTAGRGAKAANKVDAR